MGDAYPNLGDLRVRQRGRLHGHGTHSSSLKPAPALADTPVSMDAAPTSIDELLSRATAAGASDLHLVPGARPSIRVHGSLTPLDGDKVMPDDTRGLLYRIL